MRLHFYAASALNQYIGNWFTFICIDVFLPAQKLRAYNFRFKWTEDTCSGFYLNLPKLPFYLYQYTLKLVFQIAPNLL